MLHLNQLSIELEADVDDLETLVVTAFGSFFFGSDNTDNKSGLGSDSEINCRETNPVSVKLLVQRN